MPVEQQSWGPWHPDTDVGDMLRAVVGAVYVGEPAMQQLATNVAASCRDVFVNDCDDFSRMSDISMARAFRVAAGDQGSGLMNLVLKRFTPKGAPPHEPHSDILNCMEATDSTCSKPVGQQPPPKFGRDGKGGEECSPNFKEAWRSKADVDWDGVLPAEVTQAVTIFVQKGRYKST